MLTRIGRNVIFIGNIRKTARTHFNAIHGILVPALFRPYVPQSGREGLSMKDKVIDNDTNVLGTTPVFSGTRVPVRILIEYLEAGDRMDDFLENHQTVSRGQAIEVLERAKRVLAGTSNEALA